MLSSIALLAVLHLASAADPINGTWQITGDVVGNPLNEVCTIKQDGTQLSGSCTGESGQAYDLTGEVKEDGTVTFKHGGEYQGTELTIVYSGTLTGQELKGTVNVQPFGVDGEFTATPAPAPAPAKP
jgi:hypothetical protein